MAGGLPKWDRAGCFRGAFCAIHAVSGGCGGRNLSIPPRSIKIFSRLSELIQALAEATSQFRQFPGPEEDQYDHQDQQPVGRTGRNKSNDIHGATTSCVAFSRGLSLGTASRLYGRTSLLRTLSKAAGEHPSDVRARPFLPNQLAISSSGIPKWRHAGTFRWVIPTIAGWIQALAIRSGRSRQVCLKPAGRRTSGAKCDRYTDYAQDLDRVADTV